jgi:hypothetical protein
MAKTYNLSSKSDMRKFQKNLESEIKDHFNSEIISASYDYECPSCNNNIQVKIGSNTCPFCKQGIIVDCPDYPL